MSDSYESNEAVWKSPETVAEWVAASGDRERSRVWPRRFVAELLAFSRDESVTVVDLGAGTGAGSKAVLDAYPAATAVLAEYSPQMMAEGRRALGSYEGRYRYVEIDLAVGRWPDELAGGLDGVISSLCVHHLPDDRKSGLFAEIFERLAPGAWFVNYDEVSADNPAVEEAWQRVEAARDPVAADRHRHRSPEEQARWENHVRHLLPLEPQLGMLREAGFDAVDVYWRELRHVVYAGRRAPD